MPRRQGVPWSRRLAVSAVCLVWLWCLAEVRGQQLLDRVMARVNGIPITLTDVNAAIGLGLVAAPADANVETATSALIDRQLLLAEVARFAPPEPAPAAVTKEVDALKARLGDRLPKLLDATGLDEQRLRDLVRDTLRIRAYLDQRFGATVQVTDEEVERYYREHPQEFTSGGILIAFEDAEPVARQRAAARRRQGLIEQWLADLRARADISIPRTGPAPVTP